MKYVLPVIPAGNDVIKPAFELDPRSSCHNEA